MEKSFASVIKTAQLSLLHTAERSERRNYVPPEMCLYMCPSMSAGLLLGLGSTAQPWVTLLPGLFRWVLPPAAAAIPKAVEPADLCQTPKSCSLKVSVVE